MEIPVRQGKTDRRIDCRLLKSAPTAVARRWREALPDGASVTQEDAVEFIDSAVSKWALYESRGRVAPNQKQLFKMIDDDGEIDVLGLYQADARWFGAETALGICQFRRTWSHNIAIDYLAVHPILLSDPKPVSGVGTALLYAVSLLARRVGAQRVWLETTEGSVEYYRGLFGEEAVTGDLLIANAEAFHESLDQSYKNAPRKATRV